MKQAIALAKKPHIVVTTPGRMGHHITKTRGFSLRSIRYLVLDEGEYIFLCFFFFWEEER